LVQPQQAATVCELDLVQHACRSWNGLRLWIRTNGRRTANEPLNLTLDFEHAHLSGYSMTSSARPRIVGGIVRPSTLAVARLTDNRNFAGRSTGSSLGRAP